jgi:hypothetical protein
MDEGSWVFPHGGRLDVMDSPGNVAPRVLQR